MTKLAEQIRQSADQAWETLLEGWRELSTRASGALTHFTPKPQSAVGITTHRGGEAQKPLPRSNRWAFLAADVFESDDAVVVRIEAPGMQREDFNIALNADVLTIWGEKRIDSESTQGQWRMVQSAYGNFRREVLLPASVKADQTRATYREGVLRIELPKAEEARPRRIAVLTA
jgi:HSP20 family protein